MVENKFEPVYGKGPILGIQGKWTAILTGPDGKVKDRREGKNLITTNGAEKLAEQLVEATASATALSFKYMAIGTDSTAALIADTALGTESARHTGTVSYVSGQIYRCNATFVAGVGTGAIVEYGIFTANAAGTMLNRDVEAVINKGAGDQLTVQADLTIAAG